VEPESQRRGVGGTLLDTLHRMSENHPASVGVGLDTENRLNIPLYERSGYQVVASGNYEGLEIWCMFRPNRGTLPGNRKV